jgi:pheromone shutdown protein TraB
MVEKMITLIGVGHVFGLDEHVKRIIRERRPNVVCLELDQERFEALRERGERDPNPFFNLLERFQERIAHSFGATPGSEMLAGADAARDVGANVALIDRDIRVTLNRLLKVLPLKEKVILFVSGISSLFASKKRIDAELARIRTDDSYIDDFTKDAPMFKQVLIDERNEHMANAMLELSKGTLGIVAVIGDGHVLGVEKLLKDKGARTEVIRLRDIDKGEGSNRFASFRF